MSKRADTDVTPVTIASGHSRVAGSEYASMQARLTALALDPNTSQHDILHTLAEQLARLNQGFALLQRATSDSGWVCVALHATDGSLIWQGQASTTGNPQTNTLRVREVPSGTGCYAAWSQLLDLDHPELNASCQKALGQHPVIGAVTQTESGEDLLLINGANLDPDGCDAVSALAQRLSLCLAIVRLRADLSAFDGEFGQMFQDAAAALMLLLPGGEILRANRRMQALLDLQELKPGQSLEARLPVVWDWFVKQRQAHHQTSTAALEFSHPCCDGEERTIRMHMQPVRFAAQRAWLLTGDDISRVARLETMVERLEALRQDIADHLSVGMVVQDVHGHFAYVNEAAAAMLGRSIEEMLGEPIHAFLPMDQLDVLGRVEQRVDRGEPARYELEFLHKTGERVPVLISERDLAEQARFDGKLSLLSDLSKTRKAEQTLLEQNHAFRRVLDRLQALNQTSSDAFSALDGDMIIQRVGEALLGLGMTSLVLTLDLDRDLWKVRHATAPVLWKSPAGEALVQTEGLAFASGTEVQDLQAMQDCTPSRYERLQDAIQVLGGDAWELQAVWEDEEPQPCLLAPLRMNAHVSGALLVFSQNLTDEDIPAVAAFANQLSMAMESAHVLSASMLEARRATTMARLLALSSSVKAKEALLQSAMALLLRTLDLPACSFFQYEVEKQELTLLFNVRAEPEDRSDWLPVPTGAVLDCAFENVGNSPKTMWVDARSQSITPSKAGPQDSASSHGVQPCLLFPLQGLSEGEFVAAFYLHHEQPQLPEADVQFLSMALEQVKLGYEKLSLNVRAQRQVDVDKSLAVLVKKALASLDVQEVVRAALQGVADLIACDYVSLTALDFESGTAHVLGTMGPYGHLGPGERMPLEAWGPTSELQAGRSVFIAQVDQQQKRFKAPDWGAALGYRSWASIPLQAQGHVFAALSLGSRQSQGFSPADLDLAKRFASHLSVAMTNARNFQSARERANELRALYDLAQEIAGELDIGALLRTALARTCDLLGTQQGAVFLVDSHKAQLTLVEKWNLPSTVGHCRLQKGEGLAGKVWQQASPLVLERKRGCGDPAALEACYATGAAMGVPMIWAGEVRGVFCVYEPNAEESMSRESVKLLERMAAQVALGMQSAEKHAQLQRKANQLRVVHDLGRRITSILNREQLLEQIVRQVAHSFGLELVVLYLQMEGALVEASAYYLPEDCHAFWEPTVLAVGREGISGMAACEGKPILVPDVSQDQDFLRLLPVEAFVRSAVAIPLKLKGEVIGVLLAESERLNAFDETDVATLQALGAHVSTSIENARLYDQTQIAQERLLEMEKLRALGLMTAGIAHDFNNLLAVISARAELALRSVHDPTIISHLTQVMHSARDGSEIIRRLQQFARTEEDDAEFVEVDPNQLVNEAIELSRPRWKDEAQGQGVQIEIFTQLLAKGKILGVPSQLREMLFNLILNSIEAMPDGGSITIDSVDKQGQVRIVVKDIGLGMREEVLQQIFVPYFTTKQNGTGLGMPMVYGVVQRHGGQISIDSKPGAGTIIRLIFPAATTQELQAAGQVASAPQQARVRLSIMVVEDEEALREGLVDLFTSSGHEVLAAPDSAEALEMLQDTGAVDIVFTDLGMPHVSGWELVKRLRSMDPNLPIVVLSGWGQQIDQSLIRRYGVRRVIAKPFSVTELHAVLESEVQHSPD